jgi:hypothetical protein
MLPFVLCLFAAGGFIVGRVSVRRPRGTDESALNNRILCTALVQVAGGQLVVFPRDFEKAHQAKLYIKQNLPETGGTLFRVEAAK